MPSGTRQKRISPHFYWFFAQEVDHRDLVNTRDRAVGRKGLAGVIFPFEIFTRVLLQWDAGIATLLRAVVNKTVFAHIQITASGVAVPIVWQTLY